MLPTTPTILNAYGRPVADPTPILDARGNTIVAGRIIPQVEPFSATAVPKFEHDDATPTRSSFARYCDWRVTKCKPRNLSNPHERIDEVNQALHEFIGEVAELGELLYTNHLHAMIVGETKAKMVDEIGDVFFCGAWCLDAFGPNPLREDTAPAVNAMIADERRADAQAVADRIARLDGEDLTVDEAGRIVQMVSQLSWQMNIFAGLLSNSFKKSLYQQRAQPLEQQIMRVLTVMSIGAHLLVMAGAEPEDALQVNIEKLDHRYPNGYEGPGGGIRTGKGAGSEVAG